MCLYGSAHSTPHSEYKGLSFDLIHMILFDYGRHIEDLNAKTLFKSVKIQSHGKSSTIIDNRLYAQMQQVAYFSHPSCVRVCVLTSGLIKCREQGHSTDYSLLPVSAKRSCCRRIGRQAAVWAFTCTLFGDGPERTVCTSAESPSGCCCKCVRKRQREWDEKLCGRPK